MRQSNKKIQQYEELEKEGENGGRWEEIEKGLDESIHKEYMDNLEERSESWGKEITDIWSDERK